MRTIEKNFFNNWNEFSLQKPDEKILDHLEIVQNQTKLNGEPKHKNKKSVIKTFALFLTHNYGSAIYELCNFLKYLENTELSIYDIMILDANDIAKKIKQNELRSNVSLSSKIEFKIENKSFEIYFTRIHIYIIILDFIEEFLGLEEILKLEENLKDSNTYESLQKLSNHLSRQIYNYLKTLLPSSHIQNFSTTISNQILSNKKSQNPEITSDDITDDFILNFWINSKNLINEQEIKTFTLAADICLNYRRSVKLNNIYNLKFINQINDEDSLTFITNENIDDFLNQVVDDNEDNIVKFFDYLENLNKQKINILKKNELNELRKFVKYQELSFELPLTILRIVIFGSIQNKIVEAFRRKNNTSKNKILNEEYSNEYNKQVKIYNKFLHNLNDLKNIIFYRLWSFNAKFSLEFIRDFLTDNEVNIFNSYLNSITESLKHKNSLNDVKNDYSFSQSNNVSLINNKINESEIDIFLEKVKIFLKEQNDFASFNNFLKETKKKSNNFRRSGINFDLNNQENTKIFIKSYRSLNEIKEFMFKYLSELESKVTNLKNQFNSDKEIFFNNFKKLYYEKE